MGYISSSHRQSKVKVDVIYLTPASRANVLNIAGGKRLLTSVPNRGSKGQQSSCLLAFLLEVQESLKCLFVVKDLQKV